MKGTMKQAVMTKPGVIVFQEADIPDIEKDEVLVQIKRIGVCGSDIHVYKGEHPTTFYPIIQGHEVSGEIAEIGPSVTNVKPGDKVTIEPQVSCGNCYPCIHGMPNICKNLKVLGFQTMGTASDYFAFPADRIVKLPEFLSYDEGALIEPLAVGVGAMQKISNIDKKSVLVIGAGPVGNLTAQVFNAMSANPVASADINKFRLSKVRECGILYCLNTKDSDYKESLHNIFGEGGPDIVVECVGSQTTIEDSINIAKQGGEVLVVGVFPDRVSVDVNLAQEKQLCIIGTARYLIEDFSTAIDLLRTGKIKLTPLITQKMEFPEYGTAYKQILDQNIQTMKVIIKVNED